MVIKKKSAKKKVQKVKSSKKEKSKKKVVHAPSKKKDKKEHVSHSQLLHETEQDQDDWEEFKNEKKKDDEVNFDLLEGFDFEDETYAEPEEKAGDSPQPEEVFDDEP